MGGKTAYEYRKNYGAQLAKEDDLEADIVVPVPDSGNAAALGYAQEKNIPFEELVEDSQKLISPQKAQAIFKNKNINQKIRVLNYCGGGIAATLNAFVLRQLGIEKIEIYDNSMSEWAMDHQLPIEKDYILK